MNNSLNNKSLIEQLLVDLNNASVIYCHWKSNIDLDKALQAEGDLDLLINRQDKGKFDEIVLLHGFKKANSRWERQFPGMEDYIGWDEEMDVLVHLHVHYQLVLGATYAKSIHLPIEQKYLENIQKLGVVKVPDKRNELLVFLFRHVLKARIYDFLINRKIKNRTIEELDYLQSDLSLQDLTPLIDSIGMNTAILEGMIKSLRDRHPLGVLIMKRKLQKAMKDRLRFSIIFQIGRPVMARLQYRFESLFQLGSQGKRPSAGGFSIAVIGCDGAGKSTLVDELVSWLSQSYAVLDLHFGKPDQTLISYIVLRVAHRVDIVLKDHHGSIAKTTKDFAAGMQQLFLAKDRYRALEKMRRAVGQGKVVVVDRYPHKAIKQMESMSHIEHFKDSDNTLLRSLAKKTASYYSSFDMVGLLLVLKVSPEVSLSRRPEDDLSLLKSKINEVNQIPAALNTCFIDADQEKQQVILKAKHLIWSRL